MKQSLLILVCSIFALTAHSQALRVEEGQANYDRSSLYLIMVEDQGLINAEVIKNAYFEAPMPDKFNDHNLELRCFSPKNYAVTKEDCEAFAQKYGVKVTQSDGDSFGKGIASELTGGLVDAANIRDLPVVTMKVFDEHKVAAGLVSKWFCRDSAGNFHTDLIVERGHYNASGQDAMKAISSARGLSSLGDAGAELISNTFVVVTRFNYVDKKDIVAAAKKVTTAFLGSYASLANTIVDATVQGYVVKATSHLYRLHWNDSIQNIFYDKYYVTPEDTTQEAQRKRLEFCNTNLFELAYVGTDNAWSDVSTTAFSNKTQDQMVHRATIRSLDAVIAKLQKKYEQFRTKTPLISTEPILAHVGLKEGVEAGDKFEVLEKQMDPQTSKVKYVRKSVITVDRKQIWDNRYNAEQEAIEANKGKAVDPAKTPKATMFKGNANGIAPGMLIRQLN